MKRLAIWCVRHQMCIRDSTMVTRSGRYDVRVARHSGDPGIVAVVEVADPAG